MKPSTNWYSGSTNISIIAVVAAEALGEGLWRGWPAAVLDVMGLGGRAMTGLGGHSMSPRLLFSFQDFFFSPAQAGGLVLTKPSELAAGQATGDHGGNRRGSFLLFGRCPASAAHPVRPPRSGH